MKVSDLITVLQTLPQDLPVASLDRVHSAPSSVTFATVRVEKQGMWWNCEAQEMTIGPVVEIRGA